jgi:hypothetical protein
MAGMHRHTLQIRPCKYIYARAEGGGLRGARHPQHSTEVSNTPS